MNTSKRIFITERSYAVPGKSAQIQDELKSWPFDDVIIGSPIGTLCTLRNINISLFRANHPGGGDDCHLAKSSHRVMAGRATRTRDGRHRRRDWPMSVVLRGANNAFIGEYVLPRRAVSCREGGTLATSRFDNVNPGFRLAEYPQLWTLELSRMQC